MIVSVTFHIPGALREFAGGHSSVEIAASPSSVADALATLSILYPGVRDRIATEQGQIREHQHLRWERGYSLYRRAHESDLRRISDFDRAGYQRRLRESPETQTIAARRRFSRSVNL